MDELHHIEILANDWAEAYGKSDKTQLSGMGFNGLVIPTYEVLARSEMHGVVAGLVEKPSAVDAPSNLASLRFYVMRQDIFDTLRIHFAGSGGKIQLPDEIMHVVEQRRRG